MSRTKKEKQGLSRREREIMDIIYRLGQAAVQEVLSAMTKPPSYSSVRALMRILTEKGHLKFEEQGPRYVYTPTIPAEEARRSALHHLAETFFDGSAPKMMVALLDLSRDQLSDDQLDELATLVEAAKAEGN